MRSLFEDAFEHSPIGMTIYDSSGQCVAANPAIGKIVGASTSQILSQNIHHIESWKQSGFYDFAFQALETHSDQQCEIAFTSTFGKSLDGGAHFIPFSSSGDVYLMLLFKDISERKKAESIRNANEKRLSGLLNAIPDLMFQFNREGVLLDYKAEQSELLVQDELSMIGLHIREVAPPDFADFIEKKIDETLTTKEVQIFEYQLPIPNKGIRDYRARMVCSGDDEITSIVQDITETKRIQRDLKNIEWLLTKSVMSTQHDFYQPAYGDVTELNTTRLILDSVGYTTLRQIAVDTIDLLDTSVAVYEKNGDYAMGVFSSSWCKVLDSASRNLCNTTDNKEALCCGKWLCHENCWNDSAKKAIQTGKPTDIECIGGIHLYAVPIFVDECIIGVINIGYGNPPTEKSKLEKLAQLFSVNIEQLSHYARNYESRPKYIIELAKKKLHIQAELIGQIVQQRIIERKLKASESLYRSLFKNSTHGVALVSNRLLELKS
jgi:PAS domain S-box-containing protein